jgi:hypothetical protein
LQNRVSIGHLKMQMRDNKSTTRKFELRTLERVLRVGYFEGSFTV